MKYILIFTVLLLLTFLLNKLKKTNKGRLVGGKPKMNKDFNTSIVKSDIEKLELKGAVKSIKDVYWIITINDGQVEKKEPFDYTIKKVFDVKGNLLDTVIESNNPYYKNRESKLFYDNKGNLIEEKKYREDGKLLWKKSFSYNEDNNVSEWVNFNIEGIGLGRITFEYDINYNKTFSMLYRYDESLYGKLNYKYDKYGNCLNQYKEDSFCNPIMAIREIVYYEV